MGKKETNSFDQVKKSGYLNVIATRIASERKSRGLTQSELADLSNVGINFISQIENGKESAHLGKVLSVLAALGLELDLRYKK